MGRGTENHSCHRTMNEKERVYTKMFCLITNQEEPQFVVKMDDDGVTLRCAGCGGIRGYEIGFFADKYQSSGETTNE